MTMPESSYNGHGMLCKHCDSTLNLKEHFPALLTGHGARVIIAQCEECKTVALIPLDR